MEAPAVRTVANTLAAGIPAVDMDMPPVDTAAVEVTAVADTAASAKYFVWSSPSPLNRRSRSRERGFLARTIWVGLPFVLSLLAVWQPRSASTYQGAKSTIRGGNVHRNSGHELVPAGSTARKRNPLREESNPLPKPNSAATDSWQSAIACSASRNPACSLSLTSSDAGQKSASVRSSIYFLEASFWITSGLPTNRELAWWLESTPE
jgi:hypothetical protein